MKRAWIASAVASILFAIGISVVGNVAGVSSEDNGIPHPGPATRALYSATPVGSGDDFGVYELVFNWRAPEAVWNEDFQVRNAWRVDMEIRGDEADRLWAVYDAETGLPMFDGQESTRYYNYDSTPFVDAGQTELPTEYTISFDLFHELRGPCGLMDGPGIDAGADEVVLQGHCSRLDGQGSTTFQRIGPMHYQQPDDPRFEVAYSPGVPVPTVMTIPLSDMLLKMPWTDVVWRLELESWTTGTPYVSAPSLVEALPVPVQKPRTDWGLDDSGIVDHPFPLRDAYAAALASTSGETVQGFIDDHPETYLRSAWSYRVVDGSGNFEHHWALTWTDGTDWIAKKVVHRATGAMGLTTDLADATIDVTPFTPRDTDNLPHPSTLPDTMPNPADVLALQERFTGGTEELNRYGFQFYDWGGFYTDGSPKADLFVAAGTFTTDPQSADDDPASAVRTNTEGSSYAYNQLMIWGDGHAVYTERALETSQPILDPPGDASPTQSEDTGGSTWVPPTAGQTAGVGMIAAAGGLLVYLVPGMKAPAMALFSRIRGEHLLEHPGRSAIMAVVEADPGIHFKELMRRLDMGRATLDHHLQKLAEGRLIRVHVSPGYTCYFPRKVDRALMAASPFLRSPGPKSILEEVVHGDGGTVASIAKKLNLSTSTVSHHLQRMKDAGLVEGGGREGFRPTALAMRAI